MTSKEAFRDAVRAAVKLAPPGTWITGGDWDEHRLGGVEPDRTWIDDLTPDHPVLLARWDCHTALVNATAFRAAGIDVAAGEVVEGGVLERFFTNKAANADGGGDATNVTPLSGIVRERAIGRIKKAFPAADTHESMTSALAAAGHELTRHGVTGVHSMTSLDFGNVAEVEFLEHQACQASLPIRVACAVRPKELEWVRTRNVSAARTTDPNKQAHDDVAAAADASDSSPPRSIHARSHVKHQHRYETDRWVRVLGVKTFLDGSLGSRTACFLEPFHDRGGTGVSMVKSDALTKMLADTDAADVMLMAHAIGDGAVRQLLSAYEDYVLGDRPAHLRHRSIQLRIEHCQHVSDDDIERIRRLTSGPPGAAADGSDGAPLVRVIASMQPTHADSDKAVVTCAIGECRAREAYRFRSLRDAGAVLAFGSDWMVMPPRPIETLVAATAPPKPFAETEAVSAADAIRALTLGPAVAARWDGHFGRLAPGYAADFTVLARDVTHAAAEPISPTERLVAYTVVDGVVRFDVTDDV